ncbi:MAG: NAD-dependent succinate-semialdehyde dehydrogenase [Desulfobulbus sp.]|jgi:succinate-semialdehyde dehydrogenase/glutarate-semialdehyde dehydrogenase|uniref:NAD-dependent succinate-semialdehyde dehydrogenase n=1 Tax=Desulfobulbus sp. TaxID=895 RepID=UPI00283EB5DD|nr:NAD-dependent succinate-semialdehyde dehydrogenase [Desulfobulbus sp.]MDR2549114.1 NAD-dependent succinate-semialdehyde dehydrogenase [Desulfobulbus sp.]
MAVPLTDPTLLKNRGYINGSWIAASDRKVFPVTNPATAALIAEVADMGTVEAEAAIAAANAAWPAWRSLTAKARATVLKRWFELILSHGEDLARLITAEQGKPLPESRGEVSYGASFVEWFAEEAKRAYGTVIPSNQDDRMLLTIKQPIGVCAAITPWNFPLAMITRKVAPALAAGCTVVCKPAESTPLTALALAALAEQSGMPPGVFNVIPCDGSRAPEIGRILCESPLVRKLSFTGSTEVGRLLMRQSAATIKKLSLELGGNAPFIVFDDADLDAAVDGALASKYRNAGQTCVCANRIYVQDGVYDAFAEKLAAKVSAMKVGAGTEPEVAIGPLIEPQALVKVKEHIADALAGGARLLVGGKVHARGGLFFEPTILVDVSQQMLVAREETFGPVAPLFRFRTDQEAIDMANASEFGLAAYFYARDIGRVLRVAAAIEAGMVCVNSGLLSTEVAPFGGIKQSGLGREGAREGLEEYLEIKYVALAGM